jgi:hypothetical protein
MSIGRDMRADFDPFQDSAAAAESSPPIIDFSGNDRYSWRTVEAAAPVSPSESAIGALPDLCSPELRSKIEELLALQTPGWDTRGRNERLVVRALASSYVVLCASLQARIGSSVLPFGGRADPRRMD